MTLDAKELSVTTVTLMLVYIMVFSITSLSIMTLVNKTQAMKKLNIMTLIFTTLSLITPHKYIHPLSIMLSVIILSIVETSSIIFHALAR
jgi:hypothetical protein